MEPLELYVDVMGAGPPLVLAHGFGGSARNFRPQQRAFADRFRVIAYDARGHARSPAPRAPESYSEAALVGDLARIVEDAVTTSGERAVVGGLSLGAYTALAYALGRPATLRGLVLASFPGSAADAKGARWALGFADAIDARGLDAAGSEFVWGEMSRFDEKAAGLIRRGLLEHQPHALSATLRHVLGRFRSIEDLAAQIQELDLPTLIIAASNDAPALAPSERLKELVPHAELVIVPGAGHVVNLAAPAEFNQALGDFLGRVT